MWESGVTIQEVADSKRSAKCVGPSNFDQKAVWKSEKWCEITKCS